MNSHFLIHDVPVLVRSTSPAFLAYCRRFLAAFSAASHPCGDSIEFSFDPIERRLYTSSCVRQWGTDVRENNDGFALRAHEGAGIWCHVSESANGAMSTIRCACTISSIRRCIRFLRGRSRGENQLFMTLIRQGILLPVLARQLAKQNQLTLHASVVSLNGRSIVLTGLNGCGKSGLAFHLVTRHNFAFFADNFAVLNPETRMAHAFPEPIRVGDRERTEAEGFFAGSDRAFGKWQLAPLPSVLCPEASVGCIARIHIGERFSVRKVEGAKFADHLDSLHRFLGETSEYAWPQLYYQMRHNISLGQLADAARRQLCAAVPCYELEIPRAATSAGRYQEATEWIVKELGRDV